MIEKSPNEAWSEFLGVWPPERVRQMTLEEYTNPDRDDAFVYWLEARLDRLGSIWGGSAFKFGIYYQANVKNREASGGRVWGAKYAWLSKFGATEQEAFGTIRSRLVEVLDGVLERNLARVEEVDLAPVLKWKVAFLYQERASPILFPIFKKEMLFFHYRSIDPSARLGSTPYHVMYETLLERYRERGDVFEIARPLWEAYGAERRRVPRAWAVPLAWTLPDAEAIESLCGKTKVEPEDVDSSLDSILAAADVSEGDQIALLVEGDVRALGTLTNVEPSQFSWDQVPVNFPSGLLVNPTSEIRALDVSERREIWSQVPEEKRESEGAGPRFWKIAPGRNAVAWPEWKKRGIAAIGWPALGDLSGLTRLQFEQRAAECADRYGYGKGMGQVWAFRGIWPGDRIVANQGKHRVVGIGTVVEGYRYLPGEHTVDGEDYPHQIGVRWDDITARDVDEPGWQRALLELTREQFEALSAPGQRRAEVWASTLAAATACVPRNIILYGPPGTGKTYATVRRALELVLGPEKLAGLGDRGLMALFREHQARGQIEFVTFHQAYGYEEFVEGIRPVLGLAADAQVRYELHDGVFKRIALRAAGEGLRVESAAPLFEELWAQLLRALADEEGRVARSQSGKTYRLELSSRDNVLVRPCEVDDEGNVTSVGEKHQTASKDNARLYWENRNELGPEPEKFLYDKTAEVFARERGGQGGNHYTALWIVYGQLLAFARAVGARKAELVDRAGRVQQALDKPGPSTGFTFSSATPQYVLVIDEINRGNVSKVLGELITLLEPDKRLTAPNELKLPLSYSPQHRFGVPPNLHVLGTMNTADRSIALMDVALRRRFTFEELMPDAGVVRRVLASEVARPALIDMVAELFDALNARIRFLYDRDHQLGHAYFLGVRSLDDLRLVLSDRIVPLLQEYFYGAWDKICMVLGCPYDDEGAPVRGAPTAKGGEYLAPVVRAVPFDERTTLGFDHDDYETRLHYAVDTRFARGGLTEAELLPYLLGVLPDERYADHATAFSAPAAVGAIGGPTDGAGD